MGGLKSGKTASAWYDEAVACMRADKMQEGLAAIEHGLRVDPNHAPLLDMQAFMLSAAGRHDEALATSDRAIAADKRTPLYRMTRATILQNAGRHADAIAVLREIVTLHADEAERDEKRRNLVQAAWYQMAQSFKAMGDDTHAQECIQEGRQYQNGPRRHHYIFAHVAVRQMFLSRPEEFVAELTADADRFLQAIWNRVARDVGPEEYLTGEGLRCEPVKDGNTEYYFLVMPEPEQISEARLTCCYYHHESSFFGLAKGKMTARYFTLEFGRHLDGSPWSVLCEWQYDRHVNYGEASGTTRATFKTDIERLVRESPQPNAVTPRQ